MPFAAITSERLEKFFPVTLSAAMASTPGANIEAKTRAEKRRGLWFIITSGKVDY
jgi:hypothetical protein